MITLCFTFHSIYPYDPYRHRYAYFAMGHGTRNPFCQLVVVLLLGSKANRGLDASQECAALHRMQYVDYSCKLRMHEAG